VWCRFVYSQLLPLAAAMTRENHRNQIPAPVPGVLLRAAPSRALLEREARSDLRALVLRAVVLVSVDAVDQAAQAIPG
jgi:hypothetical protein